MKTSTAALIVIVLVVTAGLGGYEYLSTQGNGTLAIVITDAPVSNASHIYLAISNITLQREGNTSVSYQTGSVQFDLLSLVNVTKMLGSNSVPAGNYTMIRFTVTSATATLGGSNTTLKVPSGEVKVPVSFRVRAGATTTVVLDVTADMTNISASANLRPVVTVKSVSGPA